jgi:hypothetical protein
MKLQLDQYTAVIEQCKDSVIPVYTAWIEGIPAVIVQEASINECMSELRVSLDIFKETTNE